MSNRLEISSVNKGLFNRDLLSRHVSDVHKKRAKAIRSHFESDTKKNPYHLSPAQLKALSEDDTIDYYIKPVLECLGFKYRKKHQDTKSRYPDVWLFLDDPEETAPEYLQRANLTILEAKKYRIDLDSGDGREEPPPQQLQSYVQNNLQFNSAKRWGVLTNGYKWRLYL